MKVLVISGFLGAGKTTFIKQLIQTTGKYIVVLENEYGQNDLDAQEIGRSGPPDLKLLEFMEGCVCCTRKDQFSNTILAISAGIDPEYLVVEPTGVGRLSSILAAIQKVSYDKIRILPPIVVLSPETYDVNMKDFGEIYQDQIANAGIVVLSKCEHADPALMAAAAEKIRAINPHADILREHYSNMPSQWWDSLLFAEGEEQVNVISGDDENAPDMMQVTLKNGYLNNPAELVLLLEDIMRYEFGNIPRAKGVIKAGKEWLRFSLADRRYAIMSEPETEETVTQCVFIGKELDKQRIADRLNSYEDILFSWDAGDAAAVRTEAKVSKAKKNILRKL